MRALVFHSYDYRSEAYLGNISSQPNYIGLAVLTAAVWVTQDTSAMIYPKALHTNCSILALCTNPMH